MPTDKKRKICMKCIRKIVIDKMIAIQEDWKEKKARGQVYGYYNKRYYICKECAGKLKKFLNSLEI